MHFALRISFCLFVKVRYGAVLLPTTKGVFISSNKPQKIGFGFANGKHLVRIVFSRIEDYCFFESC